MSRIGKPDLTRSTSHEPAHRARGRWTSRSIGPLALAITMAAMWSATGVASADLYSWSAPVSLPHISAGLGISCPATYQCTAIDASDGYEVTWNPETTSLISQFYIDGYQRLRAIDCPSVTQCTAVDANGVEVTFDPQSPAGRTWYFIESASQINGGRGLVGIGCVSTSECAAVDGSNGREVAFNPSTGVPHPWAIDGYDDITAITCVPATYQCTTVDGSGTEVTFNPYSPSGHSWSFVDGYEAMTGVSCLTAYECTSIDSFGVEVTFNPAATSGRTWAPVDTGGTERGPQVNAISCVSTTCTAVDGEGREATFEPVPTPTGPSTQGVDIGNSLYAVSCVFNTIPDGSVQECVGIGGGGKAVVGTLGGYYQ